MRKKLDQGYRVYNTESRKIILSRDVIFSEREFLGLVVKR
jgi:hypothetical protein